MDNEICKFNVSDIYLENIDSCKTPDYLCDVCEEMIYVEPCVVTVDENKSFTSYNLCCDCKLLTTIASTENTTKLKCCDEHGITFTLVDFHYISNLKCGKIPKKIYKSGYVEYKLSYDSSEDLNTSENPCIIVLVSLLSIWVLAYVVSFC